MENINDKDNVVSSTEESRRLVSIYDLGSTAKDMLISWKLWKKKGIRASLKEFPEVNLYQVVDDKELMEFALELFLLIEMNNKRLAKERQAKGIKEAREKGIRLGRRPKGIPDNFKRIYQQVQEKELTVTKATKILQVDYKTYKKWTREYKG